jgi:2-C-methyl-D-erythritol 4-phosphate cytidylyltransferase
MSILSRKSKNLYVSSIIAAAGKGTRMNIEVNKQYVHICGIPLLARTLDVFQSSKLIDEIVLVVNEEDFIYCKQEIVDKYNYAKVSAMVTGGDKRQDSVRNGLSEVSGDTDIVLIHDGARPFIKEDSIAESIKAAYEYGASCVAVPVKNTIKRADSSGFVQETLDRNELWLIQTPQAFKYNIILEGHKKALEDGFYGTDDAVLVERLGHELKLVMGSYDNIKITTFEDLLIAEAIIENGLL